MDFLRLYWEQVQTSRQCRAGDACLRDWEKHLQRTGGLVMWELSYISEKDFKEHVKLTIRQYGEKLAAFDLAKFNSNVVDPIKLIFDKAAYRFSCEEIITNEIFRQRDKSSNNDIGYFHQRIFQYIVGCTVPNKGWDVVFTKNGMIDLPDGDKVKTVFVEMKNKHNTMNAAASGKTYMKMQGQLLQDDDCACLLVEVIAKKSQNVAWSVSVDGTKQKHKRIRRVSMDEFYSLVTGQDDAFHAMCKVLPSVIEDIIGNEEIETVGEDTVIQELKHMAILHNGHFELALYMLGFRSYKGFGEISV
jgi:hypothetical protein